MSDNKPDVFQSGDHFHGYVIERLLGKGGMGAVYLARHEMLDTLYAIKVLYPEVATSNASYIKRFLREAKIATRVRHPNMVAVHDCGYDSERNVYYLVMDYVVSGDLRQALGFSGRFTAEKAADVIAQVASALDAMQKLGVVHRDIKPENILLQSDGSVKIVDLGIAKATSLGDATMTTTNMVFGTPAYVAPEQAKNAADVDVRADIYSLGIVFFELVAGRTPYEGSNPAAIIASSLSSDPIPDVRDFNPEVPPMVATLIRRMCVKDRNRRLASHSAVLAELAKLGYSLNHVHLDEKIEYTPTAQSESATAGIDLEHLPEKVNHTLSFDTDDEEVKAFVNKLKAKRRRKNVIFIAAIVILAVLTLALILTI